MIQRRRRRAIAFSLGGIFSSLPLSRRPLLLFLSPSPALCCRRRLLSCRNKETLAFPCRRAKNESTSVSIARNDANALISKIEQQLSTSASLSLTHTLTLSLQPKTTSVLAPRPDRRGRPHGHLRRLRGRQRWGKALPRGQLRAILSRGSQARDRRRRRRALPVEEGGRGGRRRGRSGRSARVRR